MKPEEGIDGRNVYESLGGLVDWQEQLVRRTDRQGYAQHSFSNFGSDTKLEGILPWADASSTATFYSVFFMADHVMWKLLSRDTTPARGLLFNIR